MLLSSEADELIRIGEHLGNDAVQALEKHLLIEPDDLTTRIQLLAFYSAHSPEKLSFYVDQVKYFIQKYGGDEVFPEFTIYRSASLKCSNHKAYDEIKTAWLDQLHSHGTSLFTAMNAATFASLNDELDLAVEWLKDHPSLTQNPDALYKIASLLGRIVEKSGSPQRIKEALDYYEQALAVDPRQKSKILIHIEIAHLTFRLSNLSKARENAKKALELAEQNQTDDVYGYAVHTCNVILGKIVLTDNEVTKAVDHLLKAGSPQYSEMLALTGPDLSLAKNLLESGHLDAVVQFLSDCSKFGFSESHQEKLNRMLQMTNWP